jgi:hypothetical protein
MPGGAGSVGLVTIVPDMLLWYSTNNYYTNGPMTVGASAPNSTIWDAYDSVLGDSTFLIANVTYANTYPDGNANLCFALAVQPAAGGPPKLGYEIYADDGTPYLGVISNRKTGNPGRVAADKRYGAVNFLTGAACNAGDPAFTGPTSFQSDSRWNINPNYMNNSGRYDLEQVFSLNPATLVQTPALKAFDFSNGRYSSGPVTSEFGDVLALDNGNFAIVANDSSHTTIPNQGATVVIIGPDGSIVQDTFGVDPSVPGTGIWANCAAYRGGFCVRFAHALYFYDNAGNLRGSVDQSTSGIAFDTGRGDTTRLASDIRSHYVYLAGVAPYASSPVHAPVMLAIWDANTMQFVASATVSDTDPTLHGVNAVNVAVDALDRVIVAYDCMPTRAFSNYQVVARVMQFDGTKVTYLTRSFFPFVNYDPNGSLGLTTQTPGLAMTPRQICISCKGVVNSTNNPAAGPDTPANINLYTVIGHPAPVPPPRPQITVTRLGSNTVLSWSADAGLFTLQFTPMMSPAAWADVSPQPAIVPSLGNPYVYTMTVPIGTGDIYFRLAR